MDTTKDFYEILGVSRDSTTDEIKKAFRQQARKFHPDNKETGNEEKFKEINLAYEVLGDPEKKGVYDSYGIEGLRGSFQSGQFNFGFGDLSDLFAEFFGQGRSYRSGGPERGLDIRYDLEIDFLEAINGCKKEISYQVVEDCGICKGTGSKPGAKLKTCNSCNGLGEVRQVRESFFGHMTQISTCPSCGGAGKVVLDPCSECKGKGVHRVKRNIEVKVPCGIDDGARLRWGGKGEAGKKGGPPGDLYVILHVKEHEVFIRQGEDIVIRQNISVSQAALGGSIKVPTTEGEKTLHIPPGIQTSEVLKIQGLGVPKLNNLARRGDELIEIFVETPTKLSAEERKIFEQLEKIQKEKEGKKKGFF